MFSVFRSVSGRSLPLSVCLGLGSAVLCPAQIVINEIHCDETNKTIHADFVELYNAGTEPADLSGWRFTDGVDFTFPAGVTIPPGGYVVVAENPAVIQTRFSYTGALGPFANGTGLSASGERVTLKDSAGNLADEVEYGLGSPWPTTGVAVGSPLVSPSLELINPALDNNLGGSWRSSGTPALADGAASTNRRPTPRARNRSYSATAPPQIRQVRHQPSTRVLTEADETIRPGEEVIISAKITDPDGMGDVTLQYQTVEPGDYIKLSDPRYATAWTSLPMRDDGQGGDTMAGDGVYAGVLPAALQTHRRMVRYRVTALDSGGLLSRAPQTDDTQPNYAYFVYGTMPTWTAKYRSSAPEVTYDFSAMEPLPVYQLITTRKDHVDAQYIPGTTRSSGYEGSDYLWGGALVYRGRVYDHIRYRARGGVWRYAMGKNMWKFDFNRGHSFQALDDFGKPYKVQWSKLNFSSLIQQGDFGQRGEQGLFEGAGFRLHNLAGTHAAETHFVHFRIVENADEAGSPATQYNTDFQGMYLAVEQPDGRFLENHGLPDGNLYKMEGGTGELNNQGPTQPSNKSDLNAFLTYKSGQKTVDWWKENLDLKDYYSFRSMATIVHQYDIGGDKNFLFYHNPEDNRWRVVDWDLDLTWTTTYGGFGTQGPLSPYVLTKPEFALGYRNRMREIMDLLFNAEQTGMVLDETAQFVHTPGQPSFVDADRAMWDYNPILTSNRVNSSKAGAGRYYQASTGKTYVSMLAFVKQYITRQRSYIQTSILNADESKIPASPVITYAGPEGFPANGLRFRSSAFSPKDAAATFTAMKWRVAEITPVGGLSKTVRAKYEIQPTWESEELPAFAEEVAVPPGMVRAGGLYRARVRHLDSAGRWSHWSDPVTFTPSAPSVETLRQNLAVTEIMYHPGEPSEVEFAAGYEASDFEFIELKNIGAQPLDLTGVRLTAGVGFAFPDAFTLAPGAFAVVVANAQAFTARYGNIPSVVGAWNAGDKLDNAGETVTVSLGEGNPIHEINYDDKSPWPAEADGSGFSLTLRRPAARPPQGAAESWGVSGLVGGSPGADDPHTLAAWMAAKGVSSLTEDTDGDGMCNLEEYAAGTDPASASSKASLSAALQTGEEGTVVMIEVPRDPRATDAVITVETSSDLSEWSPMENAPDETVEVDPEGGGPVIDRWSLPLTPENGQQFVRLRVSELE